LSWRGYFDAQNLRNNGGSGRGIRLEKRWISVGKSGDFHAISQ